MYTCNISNIGTSDLPDMYTQSPRAEGIHILEYVLKNWRVMFGNRKVAQGLRVYILDKSLVPMLATTSRYVTLLTKLEI